MINLLPCFFNFFESLLASTNKSVFFKQFFPSFLVVDANKSLKNLFIAILRAKGSLVILSQFFLYMY